MKETINVNIGSRAFTLDRDAHERLSGYFDDVLDRIGGDTETMNDIECRFAEIFSESLASPMMVVTLRMVEIAIARMGRPEDFGPAHRSTAGGREFRRSREDSSRRVLRRSRTDRSLAGVCGGIAEYMDCDPTAVRMLMLLLILFGGLSVWVYVIAWIIIPEQTREEARHTQQEQ